MLKALAEERGELWILLQEPGQLIRRHSRRQPTWKLALPLDWDLGGRPCRRQWDERGSARQFVNFTRTVAVLATAGATNTTAALSAGIVASKVSLSTCFL